MSFFDSFLPKARPTVPGVASHLRVRVVRGGETRVDLKLPARSARWLLDVIPEDVVARISEKGVDLASIQAELARAAELAPRDLFALEEPERTIRVWLE